MILNKKEAIKKFKKGLIVQQDIDYIYHVIEGELYRDTIRCDTIKNLLKEGIIEEFTTGIHYNYRLKPTQ